MFVGGNAGSIYGNWSEIECSYKNDSTHCYEDYGYTLNYNFSSNSVTVSSSRSEVQQAYDKEYSIPLMQSEFTYYLIKCLTEGSYYCSIYASYLFYNDSADVNSIVTEEQIQIASASLRAAQLVINNQTVSINVNQARKNVNEDGSTETLANVTVAANGKSCTLDYYRNRDEVQSHCSNEYSKYLETDDYYDDATGNWITYAYSYEQSNDDDFKTCVLGLRTDTESESTTDFVALAKKSADMEKRALRKEIEDAQERFLMHVLKANASK